MNEDCCPSRSNEVNSGNSLICPKCDTESRTVPHETMYHLLEPFTARTINPDTAYGVCRTRDCPVLYFSSNQDQSLNVSDARTTVGFKQPEDKPSHPICYCFGFTEENIVEEIEETGESTVVEWISERVQADECACEYKNPTGHCCLGDVQKAVNKAL